MGNIGFTYYDEIPIPTVPTTAEIVASLTTNQKVAILDGFAKKILPQRLKYETDVPKIVIVHLYRKIDEIEERARALMRGEVLITPVEIDPETGGVITEAEYNDPPTTQTALKDAVASDFVEDFTATQIGAILSKMIAYSKHDGTGTWTFYKAEVIK